MPWTGFLAPALGAWNRRNLDERSARQGRAQMFLAVWALVLCAFFSASSTKLISYVLPALPAFSLLVGVAVARWDVLAPGFKRVAVGVNVLLNVALIVALVAYPARDKATKVWGIKPGILLDDHIIPRELGQGWTWAIVALLVAFSLTLLWAARRDGARDIGGAKRGRDGDCGDAAGTGGRDCAL